LDFGNRQLIPPPPDVTIVEQSDTTPNGIPIVSGTPPLTIQKDLSNYNVVTASLAMSWQSGTPKTASMVQIGTTGLWEAIIDPPYPTGTALMTFEVDVAPSGPGPEDIIQKGDIVFIDPSGSIRDSCTGGPINGAIVTLYVYDPILDDLILCPEGLSYPQFNSMITGLDGKYSWMVAENHYYAVMAEMVGYQTGWSSLVYVPPPATGLDIYLMPTSECGSNAVDPIDLELTQVQIFPKGADKVQIQGTLTLNESSDGIDPISDGINLRLFLQTGLPGSGKFYPSKNNIMPVLLQETTDGWTITSSEKARTGIQDLTIKKTNDPRIFSFILVDTKSALVTEDYRNIIVEVSSGNDAGVIEIALTENNGKYML
jgi:hypothetical protein